MASSGDPPVLTTARLALRRFAPQDALFVLELLNDPEWLANIGDRGVRDIDAARTWIANGPVASFAAHGFGLMACDLHEGSATIGMCGLIRRAGLPAVDLGYALLPAFRRKGYATEAARATLAWARDAHGLARVVAIVSPPNAASIEVLRRCGFACERELVLPGAAEPAALYACELAPASKRNPGL